MRRCVRRRKQETMKGIQDLGSLIAHGRSVCGAVLAVGTYCSIYAAAAPPTVDPCSVVTKTEVEQVIGKAGNQ